MLCVLVALASLGACRAPDTPEPTTLESPVVSGLDPEDLVTEAEREAATQPPVIPRAPQREYGPPDDGASLYDPSFYRGRPAREAMPRGSGWGIRGAGPKSVARSLRWKETETLALYLLVDRSAGRDSGVVADALVVDRRKVPGLLALGPDIGKGCRLAEPGDRSQLLIGRALYADNQYDPNSCDMEYAERVEEAWLADTSAMRFVPVEDLARVQCYRGACP